jgi:hypothetical protein
MNCELLVIIPSRCVFSGADWLITNTQGFFVSMRWTSSRTTRNMRWAHRKCTADAVRSMITLRISAIKFRTSYVLHPMQAKNINLPEEHPPQREYVACLDSHLRWMSLSKQPRSHFPLHHYHLSSPDPNPPTSQCSQQRIPQHHTYQDNPSPP